MKTLTTKPLIAAGIVAIFVSLVYALPQILHIRDGHRNALLHSGDEAAYVVRVQEVMDGHWRVGEPYMWEHKGDPPMLPYAAEVVLAALATALGLTVDQLFMGIRFVAPAVLALLFMGLLWLVTRSYPFAIAGASLALLEPGTYFYRPLLYLTRGPFTDSTPAPLMFTRVLNPLVLAIPFIVALIALHRALTTGGRRDMVVAGIIVGINFYSQLFYWSYLCAGICFLAVFYIRDRKRLRVLITVACLGLLCGSFSLVERLLAGLQYPQVELLSRVGILVPSHRPLYLLPKGLLAATIAFALLTKPRDLTYRFFLSFLISGYVLLNQNAVTGLEIQNYHFHYANSLVAAAAMVTLAWTWLQRAERSFGRLPERLAPSAAIALVVWLVVNAVVLQARTYAARMAAPPDSAAGYPSNLKHGYEKTLQWVDAHTPIDSVFLADAHVSFLLPLYTHANVFLNPMQRDNSTRFMPDDELFERWMIQLKLQGVAEDELMTIVRREPGSAILLWDFGRNEPLKARYDLSNPAVFSAAMQNDRLPADYVSEFEKFPVNEVELRLRKYRVDYLLTTGRDRRFAENSFRLLAERSLSLVAEIPEEDVRIYGMGGHGP